MQWIVFAVVFGVGPVNTGIAHDSLALCKYTVDELARQYAAELSERLIRYPNLNKDEEEESIPKLACLPYRLPARCAASRCLRCE